VTEITSIGVRAAYRRRGVASAMTAWLISRAVKAGVNTAFLMADEAEERVYARVGFVTEGQVLLIRYEQAGAASSQSTAVSIVSPCSANRDRRKGRRSNVEHAPSRTSSATARPAASECMIPCPPNPAQWMSLGAFGAPSMIAWWSAVSG
jgi:hypothetical protein